MTDIDKLSLNKLQEEAKEKIEKVSSLQELEKIRIEFLGRKRGRLTSILRGLKDLSLQEKREIGPLVNSLKEELIKSIDKRKQELTARPTSYFVDFTRPGERQKIGHIHILTQVNREIKEIFKSLNFSIVEGPEIEDEFHNFDALNIPQDHPARELWDTFWIKPTNNKYSKLLMRTHTSPVQIRYMEKNNPPFRMLCPGRVFRYEAIDASHEINFYQVEGLVVDEDINFLNFKYIIEVFLKRFFGEKVNTRLRPGYFPFVEPGVEIDIESPRGWLEIMGAGMVHPKVFKAVGYNPKNWQGFAFGLGLDRMAMLKYNIPDIRLFYENDLRFIEQF